VVDGTQRSLDGLSLGRWRRTGAAIGVKGGMTVEALDAQSTGGRGTLQLALDGGMGLVPRRPPPRIDGGGEPWPG
jgi:hypothetical protein